MSWYNMPPDDLDYSNIEYFECPYNYDCKNCEYDCGDVDVEYDM